MLQNFFLVKLNYFYILKITAHLIHLEITDQLFTDSSLGNENTVDCHCEERT